MFAVGKLKSPILLYVQDFIRICHKDAKERDPWMYRYYRYLSIQRGMVKKGSAQRAPYWHVDNPDEPLMPVYMVCEGEPTEFRNEKAKPLVIYRIGTMDYHRSPKVKKTHMRTFLRLAYSRRQFHYTQETEEMNFMVLG
jgi:hypothetical protein